LPIDFVLDKHLSVNKLVPATSFLWAQYKSQVYDYDYNYHCNRDEDRREFNTTVNKK